MIIFFLLFFFNLSAEFSVTPKQVTINEPIQVTYTLKNELAAVVNEDQLTGKLLETGHFLLLGLKKETGEKVTTYQWTLEALVSGSYPLSLYKVDFKGTSEEFVPVEFVTIAPFKSPEILPSPPFLPLTPVIPPTLSATNQGLLATIEDQQPEVNIIEIQAKTFPWLGALILMITAVGAPLLIWYILEQRRNRPGPTSEELALIALNKIKNQTYANADDFIVDLSQTIRQFVQNKYGLSLPHQTTEEFLFKAAEHPILKNEMGQKLSLFLKASDQVKFAARIPSVREKETALSFASNFISGLQN